MWYSLFCGVPSVGAGILLFVIVSVIGPATHWGEVSQGLIYHQVAFLLHQERKISNGISFIRSENICFDLTFENAM